MNDALQANTDSARLRQILTNLLSNAAKFTAEGTITAHATTEHPTAGAESLTISVSDTGVGIPHDALDLIFEEFRQVDSGNGKNKGTGLGLAITRRLAVLLGGSIDVQSEVGKGSTFTVRIPLTYTSG